MPIYEYKCLSCEQHFEIRQQLSEDPLTLCEKCGGKLEKQISLSGFQFKGGGWYVSDYSNKGKPETKSDKSEAKSDVSADKSSDAKSTTSTETASKPKEDTSKGSSTGAEKPK